MNEALKETFKETFKVMGYCLLAMITFAILFALFYGIAYLVIKVSVWYAFLMIPYIFVIVFIGNIINREKLK